MKKTPLKERPLLVFLAFSVLLAGGLLTLFALQKTKLDTEIDGLVSNTLGIYSYHKVAESAGVIAQAQNTMEALAALIETTGLSPEGDWLQDFLEELNKTSGAYKIDFVTMRVLEAGAASDAALASDQEACERLRQGEAVVSGVRYSERLGGYCFAVAIPVYEGGVVTGALRTRLQAELFLQDTLESPLYRQVRRCLVDGAGRLAFSSGEGEGQAGDSLADILRESGVAESTAARIEAGLAAGETTNESFTREGSTYFVSTVQLGYNDWSLVSFVRGPDVLLRSDNVLKSIMGTSIALLLLSTATGCAVYGMLLKSRRKLEQEHRRYAMLSQFTDTLLFEYDRRTDMVTFTSNAKEQLELEGVPLWDISNPNRTLLLLHPEDRGKIDEIFHQPKEDGALYKTDLRLKSLDGSYRWYNCQYRSMEDKKGHFSLVAGKLTDITDQRDREERLVENAQKDFLTGVYNKAGATRIDGLLQAGAKGVLLMLDLDHFKQINDTYGHNAGDAVLAQVGGLLQKLFQQGEVAARVGGDEFVVFFPGAAAAEVAGRLEALRAGLAKISPGGSGAPLTASMGLAAAPQDGVTLEGLYVAADQAMYTQKRAKGV